MMGAMLSPRRLLCGAAFAVVLGCPAPAASAFATPDSAAVKLQRLAAPKGPLDNAGRWITDAAAGW